MKRRILLTVMMLPVFALVGGLVYYAMQNRRVEAKLNTFIEQSRASKLVPVEFVVAAPPDTPKDQLVYLSGSAPSLGNWDSAGLVLEHGDDGKWHGTAEVLSGIDYNFKVTRGTWGTVESDAKGGQIPDRSLKVPGPQAMNISVADWMDHGQAVPGRVTLTGNIRLLKNFRSKILNNQRTVIVYLPPGYDQNTTDRYPVLYMQDGQNLFDESTSFAGVEWKMDEAAQELILAGQTAPFIIVGIYNMPERTSEFTPPTLATDGKAQDGSVAHGDLYGRFLTEEIKPYVDQTYRTQPQREHTLIGGSSLGGLISLSVAKEHSDVFGQIVVLSPWLRLGDHKLLPDWIGDGKWLASERIYADMGTLPNSGGGEYPGGADAALADGKDLAAALAAAGMKPDKDFVYREIPGGKHNEPSWQSEIESVLKWVFVK